MNPADKSSFSGYRGVPLEVSLDGVSYTSSGMMYNFYYADTLGAVAAIWPIGGPRRGGTTVRVRATARLAVERLARRLLWSDE